MKAMIIIPARMASTRLPGKPLADIGGEKRFDTVINVQGDLPTLDPGAVVTALDVLNR